MRPRSAAVIASRVIALWIGIEALTGAISLIILMSETGQSGGTGTFWAIIVTRALIAFFLWTQAESFGTAIARGTSDEASAGPNRTANAHAVAFSVIGVILVVNAITGLVATAASAAEFASFSPLSTGTFGGFGFGSGRGAAVAVELVTLGIGLFLVLGSGSFARYLSRSYPEPEPPTTPPQPSGPGA